MIRFAADENLNNNIVRGLLRRRPEIDVVRVQDVGLTGVADPQLLERCAAQDRIPLTNDVSTITKYANQRLAANQSTPGVIEIGRHIAVGAAIDDLILIAQCSDESEWANKIVYLPLR